MRRGHSTDRRGLVLAELLFLLLQFLLLFSMLFPAMSSSRRAARLVEDQKRGQMVYTGWTTWAAQNKGDFPMPGKVDRHPVMQGGEKRNFFDRGTPRYDLNTTDNVHSMCIMDRHYEPRTLVLDADINPNVSVANYNYENYYPYGDIGAYDGATPGIEDSIEAVDGDLHWDPMFKGDLQETCNFSWASTALFGNRVKPGLGYWSMSGRPDVVVLCTRGPREGRDLPGSVTYGQYAPLDQYRGIKVYNEGSVSVEDSMSSKRSMYRNEHGQCADNSYTWDCPEGMPSCDAYGNDALNLVVTTLEDRNPWTDKPAYVASWDD
ncbi:MAG: hypothetical protein MK116_09290 [Phycisphaerales bacterium]|nr:hypothetical protein [Phycisphaerales bacterium]